MKQTKLSKFAKTTNQKLPTNRQNAQSSNPGRAIDYYRKIYISVKHV